VVASVAYQLSSSHLSRTEPASTVHFLSMCIGAIAASLLLPWGWSTFDSSFMWLLMVAMGAMGAVSHFLLALAYQRAPATEVVPYMYSQVGFAVLFGWIVFGELPGTLAGAGIVLIILSGLVNAWQLRLRLNVRQHSQSQPL
jgi:drug/metabolite transporter (DMT)-like permease